ncbi:hypothetical protein CLF_104029, partial [Clonorchis sinensis]
MRQPGNITNERLSQVPGCSERTLTDIIEYSKSDCSRKCLCQFVQQSVPEGRLLTNGGLNKHVSDFLQEERRFIRKQLVTNVRTPTLVHLWNLSTCEQICMSEVGLVEYKCSHAIAVARRRWESFGTKLIIDSWNDVDYNVTLPGESLIVSCTAVTQPCPYACVVTNGYVDCDRHWTHAATRYHFTVRPLIYGNYSHGNFSGLIVLEKQLVKQSGCAVKLIELVFVNIISSSFQKFNFIVRILSALLSLDIEPTLLPAFDHLHYQIIHPKSRAQEESRLVGTHAKPVLELAPSVRTVDIALLDDCKVSHTDSSISKICLVCGPVVCVHYQHERPRFAILGSLVSFIHRLSSNVGNSLVLQAFVLHVKFRPVVRTEAAITENMKYHTRRVTILRTFRIDQSEQTKSRASMQSIDFLQTLWSSYSASSRTHVTSQCRLLSAVIDGPQQMWAKWLSIERETGYAMPHLQDLVALQMHGFTGRPDWLRQKGSKRTLGLLVTLSSPSAVQKVLGRAVSVQKANPTIRRLSEDRPLDARKPGHSSSREEMRKKLPDGAISADPKLKAKPIVVIAPCAPESTPRQTTATPDSSFYSTTADPSNSIGSDALEEASLTWTERPKYVQLSALLSVTDVKGATVNSTPKLQPSWIRSDVRSQVVKPTGKPTTCPDVDIGECCENRTSTEAVKLPISSSTPPKVASLIVDTTLAQDHDNQSHKPDHGEQNSPSYTQLATLIAGDSDDHIGAKERRLQVNKPYTICKIRKVLAGFKVQSYEKTSLMGAPPKELPGAATQRSKHHRGTLPTKSRQNAQETKQTRDRPLSKSEPGRPEEVKERATSSNGRNFRPRGKKLRPPKLIGPRKPGSHRAKKTLQMKSNPRNHQSREQTNMPQSPSSPPEDDQFLTRTLGQLSSSYHFTHLLLVGDFNAPKAPWTELQYRAGQQPSLLDLVITNERHFVDQVTINAPLGHSDHCVLTFDFICYWARNPEPQTWIRNFCRADFSGMRIFGGDMNSVENTIRHLFTRVLALANILPRAENLKSSATPFFHLCLSGERQLLNDKNEADPGNLGESLAPVYQSVNLFFRINWLLTTVPALSTVIQFRDRRDYGTDVVKYSKPVFGQLLTETLSPCDIQTASFSSKKKAWVFLDEWTKVVSKFGVCFTPTKGEALDGVKRFTCRGNCASANCN